MSDSEEKVYVELLNDERRLLVQGVTQLGGPAHIDDTIAEAIGYRSAHERREEGAGLAARIRNGEALSREDWRRALVSTEIAFASEYYGAGSDWEVCSAIDDHVSLDLLRQVQARLIGVVGTAQRSS